MFYFSPSPSSHSLQKRNLVGYTVSNFCSGFGVTGPFYTQFPTTAGVELSGLLVKKGEVSNKTFWLLYAFVIKHTSIPFKRKKNMDKNRHDLIVFFLKFYVTF